jgi:hypothetical protein
MGRTWSWEGRVGSFGNFYTGGGLESYLRLSGKIRILTLESFVAKANRGEL